MKTCTKCGMEKNYNEFYKSTLNSDGRRCMCKKCFNSYNKKYIDSYKKTDKYKKHRSDYMSGYYTSDKYKTWRKGYRQTETHIKQKKEYKKRAIMELKKDYVVTLLASNFKIDRKFITNDMIELKRILIKINRYGKEN